MYHTILCRTTGKQTQLMLKNSVCSLVSMVEQLELLVPALETMVSGAASFE